MPGKMINYFAGGNTARGFYSLFESNLQGLERLFILKGGPGTGKSTLMRKIAEDWLASGLNIEFMHSSSDNTSIDGIVIPALKVGIVDGTAPHIIEPRAPGAVEEYINLGAAWDAKALKRQKVSILRLTNQINDSFQKAYSTLKEALEIHEEWEKLYSKNIDLEEGGSVGSKVKRYVFWDDEVK